MKKTTATVFAFLAASMFPAAYMATVHPITGKLDLLSFLISFFATYCFVSAATLIFGVPIFLLLNKLKVVTWWSAIGCGSCVGVVGLITVVSSGAINFEKLLMFGMLGGCAGFIFWIIWRLGRA